MTMTDEPSHPTDPAIDLTDGPFYGNDPHPAFTWMRANAPVYFDENSGVWGITRYADVRTISADPKTFSNAGGIRPNNDPLPMMIDMDDPDHLRRRKLVNKGFTPRRVRDSEDRIRLVCDSIIDNVCEKGSADLVRDIAAPLPMVMIGDALGVAPEDRDDLLRWSDDMVERAERLVVVGRGAREGDERVRQLRRVLQRRRSPSGGPPPAPTTSWASSSTPRSRASASTTSS